MARQRAGARASSPVDPASPATGPVIAMGAPGSGTDLVARVLRGAGVHLGADCDAEGESAFFRRLNAELLAAAGATWSCPESFPPVLEDEKRCASLAARAREACSSREARRYLGWRRWLRGARLVADSGPGEPWGWVDPRNLCTLPVWLRVFPGARVVNVYRHGVDVATRLVTTPRLQPGGDHSGGLSASALDPQDAFDFWAACLEVSLEATEALPPRAVRDLRYEALLARPDIHVPELLAFAGARPGRPRVEELVATVDKHAAEAKRSAAHLEQTEAWRARARAWAEHPLMRRLEYGGAAADKDR